MGTLREQLRALAQEQELRAAVQADIDAIEGVVRWLEEGIALARQRAAALHELDGPG